ncbi:ankyrin 3, node of Ranvier (ankyrin G) [Seminavis robusta]|uniref:Ankyrin 3, node of Ranvier (Ankyrin G) n=1 Tax=Seminavis robusta TaxID=568900 RepID=A0A9N8E4T3_9STRA|nr:ankyrin 3, node of Ranvier (ankyrin G) [Seminavis robusta]|eukprot:Sro550_g164790.1 ankyrin 3, node of Ranvier (ankyrin G) (784) ;mRNA; r:56190-58657
MRDSLKQTWKQKQFESTLLTACNGGDQGRIRRLLEEKGDHITPNFQNEHGTTPLHFATSRTGCVLALLEFGANVNAQNEEGDTPLHWAVFWGKLGPIKALLEKGADPTLVNQNGQTPRQLALDQEKEISEDVIELLKIAEERYASGKKSQPPKVPVAHHGTSEKKTREDRHASPKEKPKPKVANQVASKKKTLQDLPPGEKKPRPKPRGVPSGRELERPQAPHGGKQEQQPQPAHKKLEQRSSSSSLKQTWKQKQFESTLLTACNGGLVSRIRRLLEQQGDYITPNFENEHGTTPLHYATGHRDCVQVLLEFGADINFQNDKGDSPLHWAVFFGKPGPIHLLLNGGANPTLVNHKGQTPLQMAQEETKTPDSVIQLLQEAEDLFRKKQQQRQELERENELRERQARLHQNALESQFETRAELDFEIQRLQRIVSTQGAQNVVDPSALEAALKAQEQVTLLTKLRKLAKFQWTVKDLTQQASALQSKVASMDLSLEKIETSKQLQELRERLQAEQQAHERLADDDDGEDDAETSLDHSSSQRGKTKSQINNHHHNTKKTMSINEPVMWGVSYDQLKDFRALVSKTFAGKNGNAQTQPTMHDVNQHILIPICQESNTSYALTLNPKGLRAEIFCTHCWDEPVIEFVTSLLEPFERFLKKPNFWICALALPQGNPQTLQAQLDRPIEASPFVAALQEASQFVVVRNPVTDLYSRMWCVCELIYAKQFGLVPDKTVVTGNHPFADRTTSCLEARASQPSDKGKILKHLLFQSDFQAIDSIINELRKF